MYVVDLLLFTDTFAVISIHSWITKDVLCVHNVCCHAGIACESLCEWWREAMEGRDENEWSMPRSAFWYVDDEWRSNDVCLGKHGGCTYFKQDDRDRQECLDDLILVCFAFYSVAVMYCSRSLRCWISKSWPSWRNRRSDHVLISARVETSLPAKYSLFL